MYLAYLQNDFIFSAVFGVLSLILAFIESRRTKERYSLKNYLKLFVCVSVCVYGAIYIKSTSLLNFEVKESSSPSSFGKTSGGSVNLDNYTNINIGDPDF